MQTLTFNPVLAAPWTLNLPSTPAITNIPANITPAALENLINKAQGGANIRVGGVGQIYTFTYGGTFAGQDVSQASASTASTVVEQNGGAANELFGGETVNTPCSSSARPGGGWGIQTSEIRV